MIALSNITVDAGINPRAHGLNKNHVAELAAWLEANPKADLPPVILYGKDKILSEGFHRCSAYESAGRTKIPCELRDGGRVEAILNAAASNQKHGLKRTNEDKRLAVRLALDAAPDWADNRIAEHVGVDHKFVGNIRSELAASEVEINWDGPNYDEPEQPTKRGPKPRKTDHAKAAARLLLKDHTRTDDDVAKEVGCNAKTVALARKGLTNKGRIPDSTPEPVKKAAKEAEVIPPTPVDAWDIPIQPHATEAFQAVPKFKELVAAISTAQRLFNEVANLTGGKFLQLPDVSSYRRGKKTGDGTYEDRFVHTGLENALQHVKNAIPTHTVCPWHYVDGKHPEKCTTCHGQNWTPVLGGNIPDMAKERARKKFNVKED